MGQGAGASLLQPQTGLGTVKCLNLAAESAENDDSPGGAHGGAEGSGSANGLQSLVSRNVRFVARLSKRSMDAAFSPKLNDEASQNLDRRRSRRRRRSD